MAETFIYILSILLKVGIVPVALLIYKKKLTFLHGLFIAAFLFVASFGCEVYYVNTTGGYSYIDSVVNTTFDDIKASFSMDNGLSAEQAAAAGRAVETIRNLYFVLLPSIIVIMQLVSAYVWLMVSKGVLALCKKDVSGFMRLCDFKMSKAGITAGILSFGAFAVMSNSRVSYAFLNIAMIILFATFVCGFSVADFKLRTRIPGSFLRFMIYVVLSGFVVGIGMWILVITGVIDAFFNIREPRRRPDDFDGE